MRGAPRGRVCVPVVSAGAYECVCLCWFVCVFYIFSRCDARRTHVCPKAHGKPVVYACTDGHHDEVRRRQQQRTNTTSIKPAYSTNTNINNSKKKLSRLCPVGVFECMRVTPLVYGMCDWYFIVT